MLLSFTIVWDLQRFRPLNQQSAAILFLRRSSGRNQSPRTFVPQSPYRPGSTSKPEGLFEKQGVVAEKDMVTVPVQLTKGGNGSKLNAQQTKGNTTRLTADQPSILLDHQLPVGHQIIVKLFRNCAAEELTQMCFHPTEGFVTERNASVPGCMRPESTPMHNLQQLKTSYGLLNAKGGTGK